MCVCFSYGYITNTKIKFVVILQDCLQDVNMKGWFRDLHTLYIATQCNPFSDLTTTTTTVTAASGGAATAGSAGGASHHHSSHAPPGSGGAGTGAGGGHGAASAATAAVAIQNPTFEQNIHKLVKNWLYIERR